MKTDQDLSDSLKRPSPPHDLEKKIRENWRQQLAQQNSPQNNASHPVPIRLVAASIAICVVITLTFMGINHTPGLVTAALNDIAKDKTLKVGLSIPPEKWLAVHQINMPPSAMPIKMTKKCLIDGNDTFHLQIAGEKQGEVHLFIVQGKFDTTFWQNHKGIDSSMPWEVIKPSKELSVLVLHTHDMNKEKVQQLINNMFYA